MAGQVNRLTRCLSVLLGVILGLTILGGPVWASTLWMVPVNAGSHAQSQSLTPLPPTPSAACVAGQKKITVTWGAIAHATTYSVYQSTTSATTGYALANTTATLSFTTGILSNGTYWYEVATNMSTHWISVNSSATASHVIGGGTCA
jgi:hypothetical protein